MSKEEQSIQIIGNESNRVYEISPDNNTQVPKTPASVEEDQSQKEPVTNNSNAAPQQTSNDLASDDGGVIETLDTAFHDQPGVAEGINPSGSSRADYYEERSFGQNDAAEELNRSSTE